MVGAIVAPAGQGADWKVTPDSSEQLTTFSALPADDTRKVAAKEIQ
jgi:hypothetical protein